MSINILKEKRVKNGSPFSWKTFVVNFKPGMLLLFPSYFRLAERFWYKAIRREFQFLLQKLIRMRPGDTGKKKVNPLNGGGTRNSRSRQYIYKRVQLIADGQNHVFG